MKKSFILPIPYIFALVVLIITVFIFFIQTSSSHKCTRGIIAGGSSKIGGQFTLTDVNRKKIHSSNFIKEPALIYFGYSYCPDVCPYDLQRNVIAVDILKEKGIEITPVFITIDPERDTPERLKEFSTFVHPKLLALTGSPKEIKKVMKLFKVYGQKANLSESDSNSYLMDHSAFSYLIDSTGNFIDYFNRKAKSEEMADRISCLVNS